jgi:hypothetical protein
MYAKSSGVGLQFLTGNITVEMKKFQLLLHLVQLLQANGAKLS